MLNISVDELLARALPLGVDNPEYVDPGDGQSVVANFQTRNRDRVVDYWSFRSGTEAPLAPLIQCEADCASLNRTGCSVLSSSCGGCLPETWKDGAECVGRIDGDDESPMVDGRFERTPVSVGPGDGGFEIDIPVETSSSVRAVEVYLMTVDAAGELDYSWAGFSSNVWSLDEAPAHGLTVSVNRANGLNQVLGDLASPGVTVQDVGAQKNHALIYRFIAPQPINGSLSVRLELSSLSEFGFNVSEVMVFGDPPACVGEECLTECDSDMACADGLCVDGRCRLH